MEDESKAQDEMVLFYTSYSRLNTDFLKATLESAKIPFWCDLKGGLLGRGALGGAGVFSPSQADALFYVPRAFLEEAEQIKIQTVGEQ